MKQAIELFKQNKQGIDSNDKRYMSTGNALVFRNVITDNGQLKSIQEVLAIRTNDGVMVGNSERLQYVNRQVAFGRVVRQWSFNAETEVQRELSTIMQMLPFNVFRQAGLDLFKLKVLDDSGAETIIRSVKGPYNKKTGDYDNIDQSMHFTGGKLFQVGTEVFLFDIDRREIKHKIFNPFMVKLTDKSVTTIKDAYESLKPEAVKQAEQAGIEVERQGEWFFIKTGHEVSELTPVKPNEANNWQELEFQRLELRAGPNRPNYVSKYVDLGKAGHLVSGTVSHSGREHKDLELNGWFIPIANTAQESVTITGDID